MDCGASLSYFHKEIFLNEVGKLVNKMRESAGKILKSKVVQSTKNITQYFYSIHQEKMNLSSFYFSKSFQHL